jgi:hypothetical protein
MATAEPARTYLVRDEAPDRLPRHVDQVHPYTLRGLLAALEDARLRSYGDNPQLLIAREGEASRIVRRFEHGHETDVPAG